MPGLCASPTPAVGKRTSGACQRVYPRSKVASSDANRSESRRASPKSERKALEDLSIRMFAFRKDYIIFPLCCLTFSVQASTHAADVLVDDWRVARMQICQSARDLR